jgi:small-conductance mechanosensitive channel
VIFNEIGSGNLAFSGFHKEWAQPTFKLLKGLIYALALVMIFPYLPGSSSPAFQGLSVFLGVVISFSSGSAIANVIAGIVITYMRPFKLGDRVKIADTVGDVVEKNFLVTRIKTIKNTDITIPNTMVLGSHILNYSSSALEEGLILHTTVSIGYDVDWRLVHELLLTAAKKTDLIEHSKEPFVLQTALHDSAVAYELNVYTRHANQMAKIYSDLYSHIMEVFRAKNIELTTASFHVIKEEYPNGNPLKVGRLDLGEQPPPT